MMAFNPYTRRSTLLVPLITALGLTGCATGARDGGGLASAIRAHYAAHATEERGACRSPKIDSIQERERVRISGEGTEVMRVRYSYFDRHADMDAAYDKLIFLSQPCGGIAERRFTLARSDVGYRVMHMDGEHKGGGDAR